MKFLIDPETGELLHVGTQVQVPGLEEVSAPTLPSDFDFEPEKYHKQGSKNIAQKEAWVRKQPPISVVEEK